MSCIASKPIGASRLLYAILSCYPIVSTLASQLTSRDFVHLTLANRATLSLLRPSRAHFETLNRACMCDGLGVLTWRAYRDFQDAFREVMMMVSRVADCQVVGRPCDKCGTVVCQECCAYPEKGEERLEALQDPLAPAPFHPPLLYSQYGLEVVVGMCPECDEAAENWVRSKYPEGHQMCVCDLSDRWVCHGCRDKQRDLTSGHNTTFVISCLPPDQNPPSTKALYVCSAFLEWRWYEVRCISSSLPPSPLTKSYLVPLLLSQAGASRDVAEVHLVQSPPRPQGGRKVISVKS